MSNRDAEGTDQQTSGPDDAYPWEHPAVLPEDRAMGLELELIELEHEREETESEGGRTETIEAEIDDVVPELVDTMAAPTDEPHVEIAAPEASDADADASEGA